MQPMPLRIIPGRKSSNSCENTWWKDYSLQRMWLVCIQSLGSQGSHEDDSQWREASQMWQMWLCILWCGSFEKAHESACWQDLEMLMSEIYGLWNVPFFDLRKIKNIVSKISRFFPIYTCNIYKQFWGCFKGVQSLGMRASTQMWRITGEKSSNQKS